MEKFIDNLCVSRINIKGPRETSLHIASIFKSEGKEQCLKFP